MKSTLIISIIVVIGFNLFAQNTINSVLAEVEKNNTTLLAYRKKIDAEKIRNKTGIVPQNPEIEFNYLWGNPSIIGNRTDFSIKQSFDFPTVYSNKNQIANLKNIQAEFEYQKEKRNLNFQTWNLCIDIIYTKDLIIKTQERREQVLQMNIACKKRVEFGDASLLEYNTVQRELLSISSKLKELDIELIALQSELARLNGGGVLSFNDSIFPIMDIPLDFEQWYALAELQNPILGWIKQELEISMKQEKLSLALSFPKFQAGYMSEKVIGQDFQGITVGISIPLWETKNQMKYAKAQTSAIEDSEIDAKLQFYLLMKSLHEKVLMLQNNVTNYRENLAAYDNSVLAMKAWEKGEISLANYLWEMTLHFENSLELLELEKRVYHTMAELNYFQ